MGFAIKVEDQYEGKVVRVRTVGCGAEGYISSPAYGWDDKNDCIRPQLTESLSRAWVSEDLAMVEGMNKMLIEAGYLTRIIPTTRQSSIELEHADRIAQFPEPRHLVRLIVEENDGGESRFSFFDTVGDVAKCAEEAEEPGAVIGFLVLTHHAPGGVIIAGFPLRSLKDDKQACAKVCDVVTHFAIDKSTRWNRGER